MQLVLTKPRKGRVEVTELAAGAPTRRDTFAAGKDADHEKLCRRHGILKPVLLAAIAKLDTEATVTLDIPDAAPAAAFSCRVRRMDASADTAVECPGKPLEAFDAALSVGTQGSVIEWTSKGELCCLDIDYHDRELDKRPTEFELLNMAARLRPAPAAHWVTHGRGLHAMYAAAGHLTAVQLAACAGLWWLGEDGSATFDLCRSTRYPPGKVSSGTQGSETPALARLSAGEPEEGEIERWLEANGYERGGKYTHDKCPVAPCDSHGTPVHVQDAGIKCYRCEADGKGWFPFSRFVTQVPSVVARMVECFTHWEHARLVLDDVLRLRGDKAREVYTAAVAVRHGVDDPRVKRVVTAGVNMVRADGRWMTRDALATYDKAIAPMLAALPACQGSDGKPIPERVTRFTQSIELSEFGYPAVTPIRGLRIYSHRLAFGDSGRVSVVVPNSELRAADRERFRPRYVPLKQRMSEDVYTDVLNLLFPSVDWRYLQLLLAARGCAEGQVGLPPLVLVSGPSGAGKSQSVHIAAAITGDVATDVSWQRSIERFRQSFAHGADAGSYVSVNELFKDADRADSGPRQALDVFLNLTPESVSHKLYVGPVPLGRVPVTVVTDITVPDVIRNDVQLARRFVYVPLQNAVEWEKPRLAAGLHRFSQLRYLSEEHAAACNAIVSDVIDRWFTGRARTLAEIAADLGYGMLLNSPHFDDPKDELRTLYSAVCAAPELTPAHAKRWTGRGWKLVKRDGETPLCEAWAAVADEKEWSVSRRCNETDWKKTLGLSPGTRLEARKHGGLLAVRFRCGTHVEYQVNEELKRGV